MFPILMNVYNDLDKILKERLFGSFLEYALFQDQSLELNYDYYSLLRSDCFKQINSDFVDVHDLFTKGNSVFNLEMDIGIDGAKKMLLDLIPKEMTQFRNSILKKDFNWKEINAMFFTMLYFSILKEENEKIGEYRPATLISNRGTHNIPKEKKTPELSGIPLVRGPKSNNQSEIIHKIKNKQYQIGAIKNEILQLEQMIERVQKDLSSKEQPVVKAVKVDMSELRRMKSEANSITRDLISEKKKHREMKSKV